MFLEHRQAEDGEILSTVVELEATRTDGTHDPLRAKVCVKAIDRLAFVQIHGLAAGLRYPDKDRTDGLRLYYDGEVRQEEGAKLQERLTKMLDDLHRFLQLQGIADDVAEQRLKAAVQSAGTNPKEAGDA